MTNTQTTPRIVYLDLLRLVAIAAMMLLHVAALNWYDLPVSSVEWQVLNSYDSLVRFCVPVMFMISGSQMLNPNKAFSLKQLFSRNILRLITAFAFWSLAYAAVFQIWRYGSISSANLGSFLKALIVGHYHLWFLYTLVGLYLVVPLLRKIAEHKALMEYFIALSLVFPFGINTVQLVTGSSPIVTTVLDKLSFFMTLGYTGYFVLGSYLVRFELSARQRRLLYGLGILSVLVTIVGTTVMSNQQGEPNGSLFGYLLPNTLFTSVAIFVGFKMTLSQRTFSTRSQQLIEHVSKLSFGMYLVHDFVNIFFREVLNLTSLSFHPIVSVPVITILVFGISYMVSWILNKIPVIHRFIV